MHLVLDQHGVQVLFDALVQIFIDSLHIFCLTRRNNSNLVCDNLPAGKGLRDPFGLILGVLRGNLSAERHDALVAVLAYGDIFEASLIERFTDAAGNLRRLRGVPPAARQAPHCEQRQTRNEQLSRFQCSVLRLATVSSPAE